MLKQVSMNILSVIHRNPIVFVLLFMTLMSCNNTEIGTLKNDQIPEEIRTEIQSLNRMFMSAVADHDEQKMMLLLSDDLGGAVGESLHTFMKQAATSVDDMGFSVFDEYYTVNGSDSMETTIISGTELNDYSITFKALNAEMYTALISPNKEGDQRVFTLIYGRFGDKWKLNIIQFGRLQVAGKTAIEHYQMAQKMLEDGNTLAATHHMALADRCKKPANKYWSYNEQATLDDFYHTVIEHAREELPVPYVYEDIPSNPEVFSISPQPMDGMICSMVRYKTDVALDDTIGLEIENRFIQLEIAKTYPGIDQGVSHIFYRAFNEYPVDNQNTPYFGFVQEVDTTMKPSI